MKMSKTLRRLLEIYRGRLAASRANDRVTAQKVDSISFLLAEDGRGE